MCSLFCPKHISQANTPGWHLFKQLKPDQGVYKLPPTQGDWSEHIRRVHVQASVWSQDLVVNPVVPDPVTLGWQLKDGKLLSLLTKEAPAPWAVIQLIRCNCRPTNIESTSKCSCWCSCKRNNLVCIGLCRR